jgi:predicted nucleic acid-binding protein
VRLVVADTGPLQYLVLIGHTDILPRLFEKISIPSVVRDELANAEAPQSVREWVGQAPP